MGTVRIPILGIQTAPDATGECWMEPLSVLATNDTWPISVVRFGSNNAAQPTVRHGLYGGFTVPKNYVGSPKLVIVWSASLIAGDVVWDFDYRAVGGDDAESLDQAGTQEAVTVTDTAPSAAWERLEATIDLSAANLAPDDFVEFFFGRDGVAAGDTLAGAAVLFDLLLEYADA